MLALPALIYFVSFAASSVCAILLVRSYFRSRTRLLLWSAACFVFLALNSAVVILDFLIFVRLDLGLFRVGTSLAGVLALLYGFIGRWTDAKCRNLHVRHGDHGLFCRRTVFFRFWSRTRERLFLIFGISFWLLATNQLFTNVGGQPSEEAAYAYVLRIIGYGADRRHRRQRPGGAGSQGRDRPRARRGRDACSSKFSARELVGRRPSGSAPPPASNEL